MKKENKQIDADYIEVNRTTKNEDRYLMLYYKTNKFSGKLKSSKEGNAVEK